MPSPTTTDEFLDLVRKSGVVDEKKLTAHVERLGASGQMPADPARLARQLVCDGVLTHFQAEQFLQGKWRRFTIGKYKVLERLGAGGMGSVYLCEHMLMRRRVAVKVLPANKAEDNSSLERFYREARAVAALDHPNIVRAYDIDEDEKLHFLVMEHVDGGSLQELIKRAGKPLDVIRATHYIRQAALGLQHAHEKAGLVHRDIKPGNILVDRSGIVKVLDMGLALFFHATDDDAITRKYDESVLGTADYLSPEQALDSHGVDIRTDIYSLGATFYFCLTGRPPFSEGSVAQKLIWHQTRQPKSLRQVRPDVPEGIVAIIEKMMAKDPSQRYQTPQEVADVLSEWTRTPIPPPPENEMPQLSLAAAPRSLVGTGSESMSSGAQRPSSDLSPGPRKVWQVPGSPATPFPGPALVPPPPLPVAPATVPTIQTRPTAQPGSTPLIAPAPGRPASPSPAQPRSPAAQAAVAPPPRPGLPSTPAVPSAPAARPANRPATDAALAIQASLPAPPALALQVASAPAKAEPPAAVEAEAPPWEIGGDAAAAITSSKSSSRTTASSKTSRRPEQKKTGDRKVAVVLVLMAVAALVVLPLLGLVAFFVFFSFWPATEPAPEPPRPRDPIAVDLTRGASLKRALSLAATGDRLQLLGDVKEMDLALLNKQNLVIEPAPGKTVVWKCPPGADPLAKLLSVNASQNCVLRNITFDGDNRTEVLVQLYGNCAGTRFEGVRFQNPAKTAVLIANCQGTADAPVVFQEVVFSVTKGKSAVFFDIFKHSKQQYPVNQHFFFDRCKFDGEGTPYRTTASEFVTAVKNETPAGIHLEVSK